ncbi:hypothetical protein V1515DRAFT_401728 [Lipomyces mesembrius]
MQDIKSHLQESRRLHPVVGGLNDNMWAEIDNVIKEKNLGHKVPEEIGDLPSWPSIYDYTSKLLNLLDGKVQESRTYDEIVQGSQRTVAMNQTFDLTVSANENVKASQWERTMYRFYKEVATNY